MDYIVTREKLVLSRYREMYAGPELDALVAQKFLGSENAPYSTDPDYAAIVCAEIQRRGYEIAYDDTDGVICTLSLNGRTVAAVWGLTFEEATCRAGLKIMGSDPA